MQKNPDYLVLINEDKQSVTKIGYEPWHFRYIGSPEVAKVMEEKGICLEEYHQSL